MWLIRGGERDRLVDRFVDEAMIAVGYAAVPDAEILTRTQMRRFMVDGGATGRGIDDDVAILSAFVNEIQVGESILLPDPRRDEVLLGEVTGRYEFDDGSPAGAQHRRTVTWLARHATSDLPAPVRKVAVLKQLLVQDRSAEWSGHMAAVRAGEVGRDPQDRGPIKASAATTRARASRAAPAPKPAPVIDRACPSCHLRKPIRQFRGDYCADCAE